MSNAVKIALVGGIFGLLGAIGGAAITGWLEVEVAKQKFNSDLVLKALESNSPDERLESLRLLVETRLLKDADIYKAVEDYANKKANDPSKIPQVISQSTFEAPVSENSRIFLLTGNKSKESLFDPYEKQLEAAGFKVFGAKTIIDEGRPKDEEVRYFFPEDKAQAEKIAQ